MLVMPTVAPLYNRWLYLCQRYRPPGAYRKVPGMTQAAFMEMCQVSGGMRGKSGYGRSTGVLPRPTADESALTCVTQDLGWFADPKLQRRGIQLAVQAAVASRVQGNVRATLCLHVVHYIVGELQQSGSYVFEVSATHTLVAPQPWHTAGSTDGGRDAVAVCGVHAGASPSGCTQAVWLGQHPPPSHGGRQPTPSTAQPRQQYCIPASYP
jgi:hypothetical protein